MLEQNKITGCECLAKEGEQVSVWNVRPFQLVSLLDMLNFHAQVFVIMMDNLRLIHDIAGTRTGQELTDKDKSLYLSSLIDALKFCNQIGLKLSSIYLQRYIDRFDKEPSHESLSEEIQVVIGRVQDELGAALFLHIPSERAKYFDDTPQFGELVANKFPKIIADIQDAGRCFAAGLYTASVFHLMRVMEHSTQYLGKRLNISLVHEKNWHNILEEVDKAIKNLPIKTSRHKVIRNKYAEASAHLRMVKDAWRNDVMHPKETYTEDESERVFRNVEDFMVHLATKL